MNLERFFCVLFAWRWLYGEKTVRKAERAWFLSKGEESEALRINGARPHLFGPIYSLGQKQHVLELYSLSLSSMVASSIPGYFFVPTKRKRIS